MDFHSLARKELQSLCKLNKIPANMTNIAMANALKSLEIIEGIENFLKPSESVTAESSIESPERNVVTSPKAPRTGRRTSARRKPAGEESGIVRKMSRSTRRVTKGAISGEMMEEAINEVPKTPAVRSNRVPAASVSRMETQLEENKGNDDQEEKRDLSVLPNSRRKGVSGSTCRSNLRKEKEEESNVQRVYSTRRSARLTKKKLDESTPMGNEIAEAIKIDSFSEGISENDLGEVSETISLRGNDSQTVLQEDLGTPPDSEFLLVDGSKVVASESVRDKKDDMIQEETGDNYEVDDPTETSVVISEALDEWTVVPEEHSKNYMAENDGCVKVQLDEDNRGSERLLGLEFLLINKSDVASESVGDIKDDVKEGRCDDYEVDDPETKSEVSESLGALNTVPEEHSNRLMVGTDGDVEIELSEDKKGIDNSLMKLEVGDKGFDATKVLINENFATVSVEMQNQVLENNGSQDVGVESSLSDTECQSEPLKLENRELNADTDIDSEDKAASDMKPKVLESEVEVFHLDTENLNKHLKLENSEELDSDRDLDSDILAAGVSPGTACRDVANLDVAPQLSMPHNLNNSLPEQLDDLMIERNTENFMWKFRDSADENQNHDAGSPMLVGGHLDITVKDQQGMNYYAESCAIEDKEKGLAFLEEVSGEAIFADPETNVETCEGTVTACRDVAILDVALQLTMTHNLNNSFPEQLDDLMIERKSENIMLKFSDSADENQNNDIGSPMLDGEHSDITVKDQGMSYFAESCVIQDTEKGHAFQEEVSGAADPETNLEPCEGTEEISSDNNTGDDVQADSDFLEHLIGSKQFDGETEPIIAKKIADQLQKMGSVNSFDNFNGGITSGDELESEKSLTKESGLLVAADLSSVQENLITSLVANKCKPASELTVLSDKTPANFVKKSSHICPSSAPHSLPTLKTEATGNEVASDLVDNPLTNHLTSTVVGLLSPGNFTHSQMTPTFVKMNHVSDDQENIDHSGRKDLTKEKAKKSKKEIAVDDNCEVNLHEKSLRELTKMLRDKLQISNNTFEEDEEKKHIAEVTKTTSRQKLSENC